MKILLIDPMKPGGGGTRASRVSVPDVALGGLAACLEADGHDVAVIDAPAEAATFDDVEKKISELKPGLVGMPLFTYKAAAAAEIARRIRRCRRAFASYRIHRCIGIGSLLPAVCHGIFGGGRTGRTSFGRYLHRRILHSQSLGEDCLQICILADFDRLQGMQRSIPNVLGCIVHQQGYVQYCPRVRYLPQRPSRPCPDLLVGISESSDEGLEGAAVADMTEGDGGKSPDDVIAIVQALNEGIDGLVPYGNDLVHYFDAKDDVFSLHVFDEILDDDVLATFRERGS